MGLPQERQTINYWYFVLAIILGIIGGVIGYYILKRKVNQKHAKNVMLIGIIMSVIWTVGIIGLEQPSETTTNPELYPNESNDKSTEQLESIIKDKDEKITELERQLKNSQSDTQQVNQCNVFCDSTGYEPAWAKTMGPYQALSKCDNVFLDLNNSENNEYDWCDELLGKMTDDLYDLLDKIKQE